MNPIIQVENFSRYYGDFQAVRGISFDVAEGSLFAFLGPNGAGKSTTINTLCTILDKTEGKVTLNGHDVSSQKDQVRKDIGIVFQDCTLDARLTVEENLAYHCQFYQVPKRQQKEKIQEALELMDLENWRKAPAASLSGGMKRRVEIARAMMHDPKILFLDEPTSGLDPQSRAKVWEHIAALQKKRGLTVFLTTHYMEEAEICNNIALINQGTLAAYGTPAQLKKQFTQSILRVQVKDKTYLEKFLIQKNKTFDQDQDTFVLKSLDQIEQITLLGELQDQIINFEVLQGSLNDVFLNITNKKEARCRV